MPKMNFTVPNVEFFSIIFSIYNFIENHKENPSFKPTKTALLPFKHPAF
tara:strand:+ start:13094 stop:13240 length:147 start_codon:yes stop_codon:yes gene_type:complete